MGCVFCATGQMGFARQLSAEEIYEQVATFSYEILACRGERVSHVVFMGMGEPLANYRNVMEAVRMIRDRLGIGARRITISTVGVVPNILKLMREEEQVKLAISLHCAEEGERSELLPANRRYGGLDALMTAVKEYTEVTKRRLTFEWALIEGKNDSKEEARKLGRLLKRYGIRRDFCHVNLIPLNPTGGYGGGPSQKKNVNAFVQVLEDEFGITATPRVRRGIDIDAGCGQLKAKVNKTQTRKETAPSSTKHENENKHEKMITAEAPITPPKYSLVDTADVINLDDDDNDNFQDPEFKSDAEMTEAERILSLVRSSFPPPPKPDQQQQQQQQGPKTTSIVDDDAVRNAKRRRKKLLKNLKMIDKLKDMQSNGKELNEEQMVKIGREREWRSELESVLHNLQ